MCLFGPTALRVLSPPLLVRPVNNLVAVSRVPFVTAVRGLSRRQRARPRAAVRRRARLPQQLPPPGGVRPALPHVAAGARHRPRGSVLPPAGKTYRKLDVFAPRRYCSYALNTRVVTWFLWSLWFFRASFGRYSAVPAVQLPDNASLEEIRS